MGVGIGKLVSAGIDEIATSLDCWPNGHTSYACPLYAVSIKNVLAMSRIESHEELLRRGVLVKWRKGMKRRVIFISHTWHGRKHPDPSGCKLSLLQDFLRCTLERTGAVPADCGSVKRCSVDGPEVSPGDELSDKDYVWLDFWSIPQADHDLQSQAIRSIPSFVAQSSALICLAPAAWHENGSLHDFQAWCRRGWCRLERLSNALAPKPAPCIVVESPNMAYMSKSRDWIYNPVCEGDFTKPKDKAEAAVIIEELINARQAEALRQSDLHVYRFLEGIRGLLLAGSDRCVLDLRGAVLLAQEAEKHLLKLAIDMAASNGLSPCCCTRACAGNVGPMRVVLRRSALVQSVSAAVLESAFLLRTMPRIMEL